MIKYEKNNQGIDIVKYICSILIIANHTAVFYEINRNLNFIIIHYLSRIAVPFFFISAGYFFYKKILPSNEPKQIYAKYIKRLLTIYVAWTLIYLPFDLIYNLVQTNNKTIENYLSIGIGYLTNFIYFGSHFHLWFFPSLIISISILYLLSIKKIKLKYLLIASVTFYSLGLLGDAYFFLVHGSFFEPLIRLINTTFEANNARLSPALVFVSFGAYFAQKEISFKAFKSLKLFLISALLFLVEILSFIYLEARYSYGNTYHMSLFLVPTSLFLFLWLLKFETKTQLDSLKYRQYSIIIYCFHIIPQILYYIFIYNKFKFANNHFYLFLFVLLCSHFFAVYLLKSKIAIKKYLY